jgi:hypothetical protein
MGLAPRTEFVRRGDADLAYQIFGEGPARILEINAYATHRGRGGPQSWAASTERRASGRRGAGSVRPQALVV